MTDYSSPVIPIKQENLHKSLIFTLNFGVHEPSIR